MKKTLSLALTLALPMLAGAQTLLVETFDYADGSITNNSGGLWSGHSGATPLNVASGTAFIDQNDTTGGRMDVNRLLSQSFNPATDNVSVLYASMLLNFSALPFSAGNNPAGSYFAHFKSSAANEFYGRLGATTEGAASGAFRLSLANESWTSASTVEYNQDLSLGTTYQVVLRFDLNTDQTTLWLNPLDESSTSVTANDAVSYAAGGLINAFALRQGTSGTAPNDSAPGDIYIDNLFVGTTFMSVVPEPSSLALAGLAGLVLLFRRRR